MCMAIPQCRGKSPNVCTPGAIDKFMIICYTIGVIIKKVPYIYTYLKKIASEGESWGNTVSYLYNQKHFLYMDAALSQESRCSLVWGGKS